MMMIPFRKLAKDRVTLRRDIHDIYVFIIVIYTKTTYKRLRVSIGPVDPMHQ